MTNKTDSIPSKTLAVFNQVDPLKTEGGGDWAHLVGGADRTLVAVAGDWFNVAEAIRLRDWLNRALPSDETSEHKHVWCRNVGEQHYHCTGEGCNAIKPYGKPCTCYGSTHGCSVDAGHRLGELWFCQKRWDALLKERGELKAEPRLDEVFTPLPRDEAALLEPFIPDSSEKASEHSPDPVYCSQCGQEDRDCYCDPSTPPSNGSEQA